ncbi:hypothetical protein LVJ94_21965 [Pendulispora rubella]|uniref:STAS domain-containing protein n=1 Tax=Pendulispora rubella TaxID=2741070 RepID=A0ABZ2LL72_9BACT
MITERGETATLSYDASENILYFTFPHVRLDTPEQIVGHFNRCVSFWKRYCAGRKVYCVVDYDGIDVNVKHTKVYASQLQRVMDMSVTIVRYGGSSLQRTAVRLANLKLHTVSQLYASREEALHVVRSLKSGEIALASSP